MKKTSQFRIVLVTSPNRKIARKLARLALTQHLAACANLIFRIESHYWWKGKLETSAEVLVLFKTRASQLKELEKLIVKNHPYDTPEFVVLNITGGNQRYFDWLAKESNGG